MAKNVYRDVLIYKTVPEWLVDVRTRFGVRPAITYYDRKIENVISYQDFVNDVEGLAYMLREKGKAGKHIAVIGENSYEWLISFCAIGSIGSVAVPVDIEQPAKEMLRLATHADATCAIVRMYMQKRSRTGRMRMYS